MIDSPRGWHSNVSFGAPRPSNFLCCRGPVWAVCEDGPWLLDFYGLRNGQGIFELDAEIPDGAVHLGIAAQK